MPLPILGIAKGVATVGAAFAGKQKAPKTAPFRPVDVGKATAEAILINKDNFGSIADLAGKTSDFEQSEALRLLEKAVPGFSKIRDKFLSAALSDLENETRLPDGVADEIFRRSSERGISTGTAGQTREFSVLRDLGINIVEFQNQQRSRALQTFAQVVGVTPRINPMSPRSLFVTPGQTIQTQMQNNLGAQGVSQGAFNAEAAASNHNRSLLAGSVLFGTGLLGDGLEKRKEKKAQVSAGAQTGTTTG